MLIKLGIKHANIKLRGDSVASLTWAETERFRSLRGRNAALIFTLLGVSFDYFVVDTEHIAGENNQLHDQLSRYVTPEQLGYDDNVIMNFNVAPFNIILESCDPTNEVKDMLELWKEIALLINNLQTSSHI
jgi:hypothetical protein